MLRLLKMTLNNISAMVPDRGLVMVTWWMTSCGQWRHMTQNGDTVTLW